MFVDIEPSCPEALRSPNPVLTQRLGVWISGFAEMHVSE